jgi:PKD repeat protein
MKYILPFLSFMLCTHLNSTCQTIVPPNIRWSTCLGGTKDDWANSIKSTPSGFIVAGHSESNDGNVTGHHGTAWSDYWIVKLGDSSIIQWQKSLGGTDRDFANSITPTSDGGYIVAGSSESTDGDVTGHHGTSSTYDCWIVKLNNNGAIQWQKSIGGTDSDFANDIEQTSDGGYIITGYTYSNNGDISGIHYYGYSDCLVLKLDSVGNIIWQKCLGGTSNDEGWSIKQTTDDGYIVAGVSNSIDGDITNHHGTIGNKDCWIARLNATGDIIWQKSLGGTSDDKAYSIKQTSDGGYIFCGYTLSFDGDVLGHHGSISNEDYWVVKMDSLGNYQWQKCLGGTGANEVAISIKQTTDNDYIIAGNTPCNDDDVTNNHGGQDYWVIKLSESGVLEWQKTLGGLGADYATFIDYNSSNEFIIAGRTNSPNSGDVSGRHFDMFNTGNYDFWVVKLEMDSTSNCPLPVANFIPTSVNINVGDTIIFYDQSTNNPTSWQWTFTGGVNPPTSTVAQPSVVYPNAGLFDVQLIVSNGCGSDTVLMIGIIQVGSNSPSTILIRNEINGNPALTNPITLFNANTSQLAAPPVKICADGSSATKIYVTNNSSIPNNQLGFYMTSDPVNNNPDATGEFVSYVINVNEISATFNHPKYWSGSGSFRLDTIVVCDLFNSNNELYRIPVQIYRAPVIFVHGLKSSDAAFSIMENDIGFLASYPSILTFRMNYESTNQSMFLVNVPQVKNKITDLLLTARINGYSVGKVDYVGHSMGGVLGRLYLQGSIVSYLNNINKFISINTPHSGSQIANRTSDLNPALFYMITGGLYSDPNITAYGDLKVNSYATDVSLNGSQFLNDNIVPSHAIYSEEQGNLFNTCNSLFEPLLVGTLLNSLGLLSNPSNALTYLSDVFDNEPNDIIVAESSQKGGLANLNSLGYTHLCHTATTDNTNVVSTVLNLLKANPTSSLFSQSGFFPPDLNPILAPNNDNGSRATGDIEFTSPTNNSNITGGSLVSVSITSSGSITHMSFSVFNNGSTIYFVDTTATQLNLSFVAPNNYVGKLMLFAAGYDGNGFVDLDTLSLNTITTATVDSITFYPEFLNIPINGYSPITVTGYFSDGTVKNLNLDPTVQYSVLNNNVATHGTDNLIFGHSIDTTTLQITYQTKSVFVPVHVFQGEIVNSLPTIKNNSADPLTFSIYPNPNSGRFFINLKSSDSKQAEISCYNLLGGKVFERQFELANGELKTELNLSSVGKGLYLVRISTDGKSVYRKVTITE